MLIVGDAATSTIQKYILKTKENPIARPLPAPVGRTTKEYGVTGAVCIVVGGEGRVVAGWSDVPEFILTGTSETFRHPNIDLLPGDFINITGELCPVQNQPEVGMTSVASVRIKFVDYECTASPLASQMKCFVWGTDVAAPLAVKAGK
ncbi:MAG: hypothetical protein JNK47_00240 [Mesorhizobium sp.]|nr:hypothetical protein [Mesorhizobium sp.]MBL8575625.1 hypothetical protein [Mesorhizobium sp.]